MQEHSNQGGPPAAERPWSGRDAIVLAGVFALAFVTRLLYLFELEGVPFFSFPVIDASTYFNQAREIAAGILESSQPYWQGPLYPYFLAAGIAVFGENHFALHLLHLVLGSINCCLIAAVGTKAFGRGPGLTAGLAAALYGPFIFFEGEYLIPVLIVFLNMLMLLSLFRLVRTGGPGAAVISGALLGLSALARPNVLLFLPVAMALAWLELRRRFSRGATAGRLLVLILSAGAVISPATIHNFRTSGEFVLISYNAGANFYIGNNSRWQETVSIRPSLAWEDLMSQARRAGEDSPNQHSRFYLGKALSDIRRDPLSWLGALAIKTGQFFYGFEYPRNMDMYYYRDQSRVLSALVWPKPLAFPYGIVAPLGLVGAVVALRPRNPRRRLLAGYLAAYVVSVALFFVSSRYRIPAVPALLIFAGYLPFWAMGKVREGKRRTLIVALMACILGLFASNWKAAEHRGVSPAEFHLFSANALRELGRGGDAMNEYKLAVSLAPDSPDPYLHLGIFYMGRGQFQDARACFEKLLELAPEKESMAAAWAHENLGDLAKRNNMYSQAMKEYESALESYPLQFGARLSMAQILAGRGEGLEAEKELRTLIDQYPADPRPKEELVMLLLGRGDKEGAAPLINRLLKRSTREEKARLIMRFKLAARGG